MGDEGSYLKLREAWEHQIQGLPYETPFDPRVAAVAAQSAARQAQESRARTQGDAVALFGSGTPWTPIGPAPIPNGQTVTTSTAVSGRVTAIAVDPTDPNIVYVGVAQGGVYRTMNGGTNWTPIFDAAQSLAIGAIAIAPSRPTTLYVGTGEGNGSGDSFGGVGMYRIDNARTTADLVGPINPPGAEPLFIPTTPFTGRGIAKIVVSPTDAGLVYATTTAGVGGSGAQAPFLRSFRGLYRSTNATAAPASITFARLNISTAGSNTFDVILDPSDETHLLVAGDFGGIARSINATSATPTFTTTQALSTGVRTAFAVTNVSGTVTFYAGTGNVNDGRVRRSTDGGVTWTIVAGGVNFCGGQCWYDNAVAVDPTDANNVLIGGAGTHALQRSTNGGTNFADSQVGLHADTHAIVFAPSNASIVYEGNDGGIYKSLDGGVTWASLNTSEFNATQFQSIAVHPTDPNFTIGGTQDNGTEFLQPNATWTRADFGDGGFSAIDQNATSTSAVTMYHTYFNSAGSLMGYARVTSTANAHDNGWTFLGCNGVAANGISCASTKTQFYAPIALGPGNPNTVYYGNDRLYRSSDTGTTHTLVSQGPIVSGVAISAIGISPQNDNVRIVGLTNGKIYATTTGSTTLTDITGTVPAAYIARAVIDPSNVNTAYVSLGSFFGNTTTAHVWKTTDLNSVTPTWVAAGTGLPDAPVNGFVIDPSNPSRLYAGTDVGVYWSVDGGTSWNPYGTGLPIVSIFDMALAKKGATRTLRIATHGRGMWEISADFADTIDPTVAVTAPAVNGVVTNPVTISGTANDNVAVESVSISVYRNVGAGQFWSGTSWQTTYTRVPVTLATPNSSSTTWTYTFNPPETGGLYYTAAAAVDSSGRFSFSSTVPFSEADAQDPATSISVPSPQQFLTKPVVISGTATDNSSVAGVEVAIYGAGKWWNGSAWQNAYTRVAATVATIGATSTTWTYSFNPPEIAGIYAVNALVYDSSYRYIFTPYVYFGIPDQVAPTGSVTTPAASAVVARPVSVTGTAADDVAVAAVEIAIYGNGTQWWNGTAWQAGYTRVTATLAAPGTASTGFSLAFNPPAAGTFAINATIIDTSGNYIYTPYQYFYAS